MKLVRLSVNLNFLSDNDIANKTNEVMVGIKSIYGDAPETLGGRVGQVQYYCYLDEARVMSIIGL